MLGKKRSRNTANAGVNLINASRDYYEPNKEAQMKKLINAIAQAVVERILSEEQVDQFVDRIVDLLIERLQNEFGDS